MLNEDQRRDLKVRLDLDRHEAQSEQNQQENPDAYKVKFGEGFREGLVELVQYMSRPYAELVADAIKREEKRFETLIQKIAAHLETKPEELVCAIRRNYDQTIPQVLIGLHDGEIVMLCRVERASFYHERIEEIEERVENFEERLQQRADVEKLLEIRVRTDQVVVDSEIGEDQAVKEGFSVWIDRFFPELKELPIRWLEGEEKIDFLKASMAQGMLKKFAANPASLDRLLEALQRDDQEQGGEKLEDF